MRTEEGLLLLNENGKILWSNAVAADLLGFSRLELCELALPLVGAKSAPTESVTTQRIMPAPTRQKPRVVTAPADASVGPVASSFRAIFAGTISEAEGNARIPDRNEKRIAVHWRLWALPSSIGKRRVLFAFSETAQATAEGPITASYRDVFEHAVEGVYRSSIQGQLLEVNPALARMCGYGTPAEMMEGIQNLNTGYYVRPNRRGEFLSAIRISGSVVGFESEIYRADNSVLWTSEFARLVRDSDGAPVYLEGSVIDISAQKRAETALRLSEEKFRSLVETTNVVPYEFHLETESFVYLGPQAESVFRGSFSSGLTLNQWTALVHPEDVREGTRFTTAPFGEVRDYQTEYRLRTATSEVIWIKQIVHADFTAETPGPVVRGFFLDITETKLREAERELSRLQLRELAARLEQVREEERIEIAGEIHDDVGQALTLLKMDLSQLTVRIQDRMAEDDQLVLAGRILALEEKVDRAFDTVRRILLALRPPLLEELGLLDAMEFHLEQLAPRAGFRYSMNVAAESELAASTKMAIFRIFQEIVTNIVRHARASNVRLDIAEAENELCMVVDDDGRGFSEVQLHNPKCFGIISMREKALAMEGELLIRTAAGRGTAVTLRVPISPSGRVLPRQFRRQCATRDNSLFTPDGQFVQNYPHGE